MKRIVSIILSILIILFAIGIAREVNTSNQQLKIKQIELQNNEVKLKKLQQDFNIINGQKAENEQQVQELEKKRQQLEEEKKNLEAQLQAKLELKKRQSAVVYAAAAPNNCGDNFYKQLIYQKESNCKLDSVNPDGCYGLGQDCNNVLATKCPNWRNDFQCQDSFWEDYMRRRYGTWERAYSHWIARVPINGKDVGNWW